MNNIFTHLSSLNAEIALYRSTYKYTSDDERWNITVTLEASGTQIKISKSGPTAEAALRSAYSAILPLIESRPVAAALQLPSLTFEGEIVS